MSLRPLLLALLLGLILGACLGWVLFAISNPRCTNPDGVVNSGGPYR